MKRISLFIIACSINLIALAQTIDVQRYIFSITVSDSTNRIQGNASIDALCLKNASQIAFDFISGKGMKVLQVTNNGQAIAHTHANNLITIPGSFKAGDTAHIAISYEGIPADGLIIEKNKFGKRGFFSDNWPNRARHWLPCIDHPGDKAAVEFIITAPAHYQVVSNGLLIETLDMGALRRTHYKETVPLATKIMAVGISEFAVQLAGMVDSIPVYSWVYPQEKDKGFYDYALAVDILPFFTYRIGPFAYKKLANVESKTMFGGMENAGAIFYSEESSIDGTRKSEPLLAHEIAHQWFGNMATEANFSHLWLSEGFATYMTESYLNAKYGDARARQLRQQSRELVLKFAKKKSKPVVDTTVTDYMQLLNANSYQKGGLVLHMLRKYVGDSLFWKGVQTYYQRFAGKNATTEDLCKIFSEVSGEDLTWFFHQWLYVAGHPVLDVQFKNKTLTIIQTQPTLFRFTVGVQIDDTIHYIQVRDKKTSANIPVNGNPKIVVDPEVNLLFEVK